MEQDAAGQHPQCLLLRLHPHADPRGLARHQVRRQTRHGHGSADRGRLHHGHPHGCPNTPLSAHLRAHRHGDRDGEMDVLSSLLWWRLYMSRS